MKHDLRLISVLAGFWFILPATIMGEVCNLVSEIEVTGHRKTKEYIIRREIQHPVNIPLDSTLVEEDRDRIENLGIFSIVSWQMVPNEDGSCTLSYSVIETLGIIPGAMPIYSEDRGWSLSGGVLIKNFRGRNENLNLGGSIGAFKTFGLEFLDPWIIGDHISLSIQTGRAIFSHPFLEYDVETISFEANVGRYFGYERRVSVGFELESKSFQGENEILDYTYIAPQGTFIYDTRDIYTDPSNGMLFIENLYAVLDFEGDQNNFLKWFQSYSFYHTLIPGLKKLTAGINLKGMLSFGNLHDVWVSYLGGGLSVRGWRVPERKIYRDESMAFRFGHHWIVTSAELRQTIIPRSITPIDTEYGLIAAVFADVGMMSTSIKTLFDQSPMAGIGVGVRIPWPIAGIIRLDYGWAFREGKFMERSFHLAVGQKF